MRGRVLSSGFGHADARPRKAGRPPARTPRGAHPRELGRRRAGAGRGAAHDEPLRHRLVLPATSQGQAPREGTGEAPAAATTTTTLLTSPEADAHSWCSLGFVAGDGQYLAVLNRRLRSLSRREGTRGRGRSAAQAPGEAGWSGPEP